MSQSFSLLSGSSKTFAYAIQETMHENSKKQELNMHGHRLYAEHTHTEMLPLTVNNGIHTGSKQL